MDSKRKMESINDTMNPFELFPIGVWELIGDKIDDSSDTVSFLQALPKLDIKIDARKRYWLFGQIFPFLRNLIFEKDFLPLRLVCKQWKVQIDSFLANQTCFRAYSHQLHKDQHNFWSFMSVEIPDYETFQYFHVYSPSTMTPPVYKKWMDHPASQNPFRCRKLSLIPFVNMDEERELFMEQILNLLSRFGSQLWYLEIRCILSYHFKEENTQLRNDYISNIVKMMKKTPNLKSLKFFKETLDEDEVKEKPPPLLDIDLPEIPCLESMAFLFKKCDLITDEFIWFLLKRYGPQIRRLKLHMRHWKAEEFKNLFVELTELHVVEYEEFAIHLPELKTVLSTISSPNLVFIKLTFWALKTVHLNIEADILRWLKRFPRIKYFEIEGDMLYVGKIILHEKGTSDPAKDCIPSLETLKIMGSHGLSYNFLRCFPYLRHLELRFLPKFEEEIDAMKVYKSDLWNLLPNLRIFYLRAYDPCYAESNYELNHFFERDLYEKLKKAGKVPQDDLLYPFNDVMVEFLKDPELVTDSEEDE